MIVHGETHDSGRTLESHRLSVPDRPDHLAASRLSRVHAPFATTALVVGAGPEPDSFPVCTDTVCRCRSIDLDHRGSVPRIDPGERYDLVFCLAGLEEVERPAELLRAMLQVGGLVVVSVPTPAAAATGPEEPTVTGDGLTLQRWARRQWVGSETVEHRGRTRLVAAFRGGEPITAVVAGDFGKSDEVRSWLRGLTASIDAVSLPRRRPRSAATVTARLAPDDPLRREVTGTVGVYVVRALWNALGFDEHRKFRWRLEHKLVQARVFNHYLGREFPVSWGVDELSRRGFRSRLIDALLARALFGKEALGHLSGDYGESEATQEVLVHLLGSQGIPPARAPAEELWLVQERVPIEREYRVHSLEDLVLPGMTFDRYGPCSVPVQRDEVNAYVASLLTRLPDPLVGESLYAWDIAGLADGRFRVIEVNLVGFHPVYERGFQASGFFQYHPQGPPLLVELVRYVEATYNVAIELTGDWSHEPNRHALYLRLFRHYLARPPVSAFSGSASAPAAPPPRRLDAVLSLRADELPRFALLLESIGYTGTPVGTIHVVVPDADLAAVSASRAISGADCRVVPESELIDAAEDLPGAPPGVRRQVARLALVARTGADYCLDMSANLVAVRPFRTSDLIRDGKAYYCRTIGREHTERYERAVELLGLRRSGWVHGTTPCLLSSRAAIELTDYLRTRHAGSPCARGGWQRFLLGQRGWALGELYFTFLEAFGLEERDYFPGEWDLSGNNVWSSDDWGEWDPAASFDRYISFYFSVVQLGADVPAGAVRRRLAPYLGLAAVGGRAQEGG